MMEKLLLLLLCSFGMYACEHEKAQAIVSLLESMEQNVRSSHDDKPPFVMNEHGGVKTVIY